MFFFSRSEGYSSDEEEDDSYEGLKENKLAENFINDSSINPNNPIAYYQSLWGMKDVQLKFTPEALEVIANQATLQNAGQEGIGTILEKLFLNLKFDMPHDITIVEITEDVILGKKPPNYVRKCGKKKISRMPLLLSAIDEEGTEDFCLSSGNGIDISGNGSEYQYRPKIIRLPSRLTDYDMAIWDQVEI